MKEQQSDDTSPAEDAVEQGGVQTSAQTPAPDPNWGMGGSYVVDPGTGARTLVERTQPCDCRD